MSGIFEIIFCTENPEYHIIDGNLEYDENEEIPDVRKGNFSLQSQLFRSANILAEEYLKKEAIDHQFIQILRIYKLTEYEVII